GDTLRSLSNDVYFKRYEPITYLCQCIRGIKYTEILYLKRGYYFGKISFISIRFGWDVIKHRKRNFKYNKDMVESNETSRSRNNFYYRKRNTESSVFT